MNDGLKMFCGWFGDVFKTGAFLLCISLSFFTGVVYHEGGQKMIDIIKPAVMERFQDAPVDVPPTDSSAGALFNPSPPLLGSIQRVF